MATVFNDDTTEYSGSYATKWYTPMLLGATTVKRLAAAGSVHPGVKNSENIPGINLGDSTTAADCDFAPSGTITVSTRKITVTELTVNKTICEKDLNPLFLSQYMQAGSNNEDFAPTQLIDAVLTKQVAKVNQEIEAMVWRGDTGGNVGNYLDLIDGFLVQFLADGDVVDVVGTTTTVANILTELDKILDVIPDEMKERLSDEFVGIWLSPSNLFKFIRAEAALYGRPTETIKIGALDSAQAITTIYTHMGVKLFSTPGLTDDDMVFASAENLWYGCDLMDEEKTIQLFPQKKLTGAPKYHLVAPYKAGVAYAVGAEIVWYHKP